MFKNTAPPHQKDKINMSNNSKGLFVGYCKESGHEVHLPYEYLTQHVSICGATGSGTSLISNALMKEQMRNGGGLLFIDGGLSNVELGVLYKNACLLGRERDFLLINLAEPENSNTYNPILFGDPQEVSSRVMSLLCDTAGIAGADFYRTSAQQALEVIISAFQCLGPYNLEDLSSVLTNEKALMEVEQRMLKEYVGAIETVQLSALLSRYKTTDGFDMEKFKVMFGGLADDLHNLSTGAFGCVLNSYNPEVNLEQCILQNKIVCLKPPLNIDNKQNTALAKLIMGECRTVIAHLQKCPVEELPNPPFMVHHSDCNTYMDTSWSRIFEQARSSRIFMTPMFQTLSSLQSAGDKTLSEIVMGNTYFKFFFKQLDIDSATQCANAVGTYIKTSNDDVNVERHVVEPEQFISIPVGECLLLVGSETLYQLSIPIPSTDTNNDAFKDMVLHHLTKDENIGLNLAKAVREVVIG